MRPVASQRLARSVQQGIAGPSHEKGPQGRERHETQIAQHLPVFGPCSNKAQQAEKIGGGKGDLPVTHPHAIEPDLAERFETAGFQNVPGEARHDIEIGELCPSRRATHDFGIGDPEMGSAPMQWID